MNNPLKGGSLFILRCSTDQLKPKASPGGDMDISMIKNLIHSIFQGSGSNMLSKAQILTRAQQIPGATKILPFLNQVPDRNDYTEKSLSDNVQNVAQKQESGGGIAGKVKSKIGI
jgi:hypothetical protein